MTGQVVSYAFGCSIILYGIIHFIAFFKKNKDEEVYHYKLIIGFISIAIGIFVLVRPDVVWIILPYALGLMLLFDCYLNMRQTLKLRKAKRKYTKVALALALLTLLVSFIFVLNPFKALSTLAIFMGIGLVFDGLSNIWVIIILSKALKNIEVLR